MTVPPFARPMPYIVGAVFFDGNNVHSLLRAIEAADPPSAAGMAISQYYLEGGSLPLMVVNTMAISEETARAVVAMFDAKAEAERAEAEKVVTPRFGVVETPPAVTPIEHVYQRPHFMGGSCAICGQPEDMHPLTVLHDQPPAGD